MLRDLCNSNPRSASTFAFALVGNERVSKISSSNKGFCAEKPINDCEKQRREKGLVLRVRLRKRAQRLILTKAWLRDREE